MGREVLGPWPSNCRCLVRRNRRRLRSHARAPAAAPAQARARTRTRRRLRERSPGHPDACAVRAIRLRHPGNSCLRGAESDPRSWSTLVTVRPRAISSTLRLSWATCKATSAPRSCAHQARRGDSQQTAVYRGGCPYRTLDESRVCRDAFRVPAPVLAPGRQPAGGQGRRRRVDG